MGAKRIIWHVGFGWNLRRRGPSHFDIFPEIVLAEEALRVDFLLLRKHPGASGEDAETLRKLWPLLPTFAVVEYKSPGRPIRPGDLDKLWAYTHLFISDPKNEVVRRNDICAVLAVPERTPTLNEAVRAARLTWENLGDGYFRVHGGQFVLYVIELDAAGRAEHDDLIYALGSGKFTSVKAQRFFAELIGSKEARMKIENMEGITDVQRELLEIVAMLPPEWVLPTYRPEQRLAGLEPEQRLAGLEPEQRLAGLEPEQRLAGLEPEQRLAGLTHDQQALALPIDVLRFLPKEYLDSLSPETRTIIEGRLAKP